MKTLNYNTLKELGYSGYYLEAAPEKVMQFGEGNFLRAFVDYWFDMANETAGFNGKVAIIKPRPGNMKQCDTLNAQDGLYTLLLRGMENGQVVDQRRVISSVSRCITPYTEDGFNGMMELAVSDELQFVVSNTTEAGIFYDKNAKLSDRPCLSYPGKLTQILHARFQAGKKGLVILPCELNDNNGDLLRDCILRHAADWQLGEGFIRYFNEQCLVCNTLVDRIVPGAVKDEEKREALCRELGYEDKAINVGEIFGVWNIEGPEALSDILPFKKAGLNCIVVPDVTPYKKRKVRILNGAHTGFVPGAYLAGKDIVRECMEDASIRGYMNRMLNDEVIPLLPLDKQDCLSFAASVQDRFNNPYVDHALLSICLNSTAKWKTRNMPSLMEYVKAYGTLPKCLAMSFAAYIAFYSSGLTALCEQGLVAHRPKGDEYLISDDRWILQFYFEHRSDSAEELVSAVMGNEKMWGLDLRTVPGLEALTAANLKLIREKGAHAAFLAAQE